MISNLSIINLKGDTLTYWDYKGEVRRNDVNLFIKYLLDAKNSQIPPIIFLNGISYLYLSQKDLYLIAATKTNENPSMIFEFLYTFLNICKSYFKTELSD